MNTMIYTFILSILNTLLIYSIYEFFETYFHRSHKSVKYRLMYIVAYIIVVAVSSFNFLFIYDFIIYWCLLFSITLLYKATQKNRFFISLVCLIFIEGIEVLSKTVIAALNDTTLDQLTSGDFTTLIAYAIARILPFIGMKALSTT